MPDPDEPLPLHASAIWAIRVDWDNQGSQPNEEKPRDRSHSAHSTDRGEAIARREPMWVLEQICQQDAAATSHRDDVLCSFLLDVTACSSRCTQPLQEGCSRLQAPTGFEFIWHPAVDLFVNIRSGIAPSPDLDPGEIRIHIRIRPLQIRIHICSDMTVQNGFHAVGPPCSLAQGFLKYRTLTCCTAA